MKSATTLSKFARADVGVSQIASGKVSTMNEMPAATAIAMQETLTLRVTNSAMENTASTSTERNAWEMPAR